MCKSRKIIKLCLNAAKDFISAVVNAAALNTKVPSENLTNSLSRLGNQNFSTKRRFNYILQETGRDVRYISILTWLRGFRDKVIQAFETPVFGGVFFVSKCPLGIERQKKLRKFAILTRKPRSHFRILKYRTWPLASTFSRLTERCLILS